MKKLDINEIIRRLERAYPDPRCSLEYDKPHELLIAVRLAAQCTDERVNKIAPALFARYPTLEAFAGAEQSELETYVHSCGFYRAKARDIIAAAQMLLRDFGGVVPSTMDELLKIPGVGRKTANLLLGDIYDAPGAITVDTHCIRLTNRIGLVSVKEPAKIETALRKILPPEKSNDFCHRMVLHGRAVCTARNPKCAECCIGECCEKQLIEAENAAESVSRAFETAVQSDIAEHQKNGAPVARYDPVTKKAYLEQPNGTREYIEE